MLIHMLPWHWPQVFDQLTSFGNWDMNEYGIFQTWVGSFQHHCMIWFDITLVSLPSIERIHIIDRSCSIYLGLGMRTSGAMLSCWAKEPCWVKQSQSWPTAFMRVEWEINTGLNSLRFWSVYHQSKTENRDINVMLTFWRGNVFILRINFPFVVKLTEIFIWKLLLFQAPVK